MPCSSLLVIALLAAPAPPAEPKDLARQILERGRYQTDLPDGATAPTVSSPGAGSPGSGTSRRRSSSGPAIPLPPAGLVWAVVAGLLAVGLAWAVLQAVRSRRGTDVDAPAPVEPETEPAPPTRARLRIGPLTDVEDLARQGRYGEAIHLLLLHLFAALQRRPSTAPAPAHTGREVLARTKLAAEARAALGVLVAAAEGVHFGGRVAVREDYESCLGHYRRFLDAFERAS